MLTVGVHPAAVRVPVLERPAIAGGDAEPEAHVRAERVDPSAVLAGDLRRAIGRPVVDHEHVGPWDLRAQRVEHGREIVLLVPGGNEDDGIPHGRFSSVWAARSWRAVTVSAPSSQASAPGVGATGAGRKRTATPCCLVDAAKDPAGAEEMQRSTDHDRLGHVPFEEKRKRAGGVLRRGRGGLLRDELECRASPQSAHLLRLRRTVVGRPSGEHDRAHVDSSCKRSASITSRRHARLMR